MAIPARIMGDSIILLQQARQSDSFNFHKENVARSIYNKHKLSKQVGMIKTLELTVD